MAHVLATFAQFECRLIGQRTREALVAKRPQGVKLGRPRQLPDDIRARIVRERTQGDPYRRIAERLDAERVPTAQGGLAWYPATIRSTFLSAEREHAQPA